jgi:hypothetical protein
MSRYGDEPADYLDGDPCNADCADCGVGFWKGAFDSCVWCTPCAVRRDEWATAQEIKRMAKAVLSVDLMKVRDVA